MSDALRSRECIESDSADRMTKKSPTRTGRIGVTERLEDRNG